MITVKNGIQFMLRKMSLLVLSSLLLSAGFVSAQNGNALPDNTQKSSSAGQVSASATLTNAINASPSDTGSLVFAAIKNTSMTSEQAVEIAIIAQPDQAAAIVTAAIQADPDNVAAIVSMALSVAPDSQVLAIVSAAVNAAPDASQEIITAAVMIKPEMVEDIVVGVAGAVIEQSSGSQDDYSLLAAIDAEAAEPDSPEFAANNRSEEVRSTRSARSTSPSASSFERTALPRPGASPL